MEMNIRNPKKLWNPNSPIAKNRIELAVRSRHGNVVVRPFWWGKSPRSLGISWSETQAGIWILSRLCLGRAGRFYRGKDLIFSFNCVFLNYFLAVIDNWTNVKHFFWQHDFYTVIVCFGGLGEINCFCFGKLLFSFTSTVNKISFSDLVSP